MPIRYRYPLPTAVAVFVFLAIFGGSFWYWQIRPYNRFQLENVEIVPVIIYAVVGASSGFLCAALIFSRARVLCGWVVAVIPPCWDRHAELAGFHYRGEQGYFSGVREQKPLKLARISARPKIKNGCLWLPVKTNSGGITPQNQDELARQLAEVFQCAAGRVEPSTTGKNSGYRWFVLSPVDRTI